MKVIAIIGSPHKIGNTARLARVVLKGLASKNIETEEIFLPDYKIEYCKGCIGYTEKCCMNTGKCIINDDVNCLKEKLHGCNGIILASPAYGRRPYAMMKNFITDRIGMFSAYTSSFADKYFVGLSTGGAIGVNKVAKDLAYEFASDFHARSYISGHLGASLNYKQIEDYPVIMNKAYKLGIKMADDIFNRKKYLLQSLMKRIIFKLIVRKIILKNIYQNKDAQLKAVYENLVKRNLIKPA